MAFQRPQASILARRLTERCCFTQVVEPEAPGANTALCATLAGYTIGDSRADREYGARW